MNILDTLAQRNEAPVLFIGSGISKRYAKNYPTWEDLLLSLWKDTGEDETSFYSLALDLRGEKSPTDEKVKFEVYSKIASYIQKVYNRKFIAGEIVVEGFGAREAYTQGIDPFKRAVAKYFESQEQKPNVNEEIKVFKELLQKSKAIFTTNYDSLLESLLDGEFSIYCRQTDLFMQTDHMGAVYKVHGSIEDPNNIVITSEDYEGIQNNSVLIDAKLMTYLINSPIIFLGYSLTDPNIMGILSRFAGSLDKTQIPTLKERIICIEYLEGKKELFEQHVMLSELGIPYTAIQTDNYLAIYNKLSTIDQGLPISQIRAVMDKIRDLVISQGKKGALKTLLVTREDVLNGDIKDDSIVVALGNNRTVFLCPRKLDYIKDYVKDIPEIEPFIAMKFLAGEPLTSRIPFYKHLANIDLESSSLRPEEIEKIKQRIKNYTAQACLNTILSTYRRVTYSSIQNILDDNQGQSRILDIISFNIDNINLQDTEKYLKDIVDRVDFSEWKKIQSQLSRLLVLWDIKANEKATSAISPKCEPLDAS